MTKEEFITKVGVKNRNTAIQKVLTQTCHDQPDLVAVLLEYMVSDHENASYFARILELASKTDPALLLPYLDEFSQTLASAKEDATVRACAKICELLMIQFELKRMPNYRQKILPHHHELMITACFDWKISNRAVAIQVHAMYALYLLGFTYAWIHPELIQVIEQHIPAASIGYQNRGRKVVKAIATRKVYRL